MGGFIVALNELDMFGTGVRTYSLGSVMLFTKIILFMTS